ncbi:tail fiber domain-containing protein [Brumimicrobium oceani]|uniref:Peptidase S74 domain-containing protein n=1 Tax=Brumimicrobium oceani TaxID=2100725 RepID=A0A2U2XCF9_9FLAO|nr:tail fiber domain-containing protein [Brumimicrobium oceani]PWH85489.1 hypothetical protein DIT68_09540 [Brumimicrobium oceani]
MKKQFIFLGTLLLSLTSMHAQNRSDGTVLPFTAPATPPTATQQLLTNEVFRFLPGIVTQGTAFGFNDQWFALGEITSGQTFYGMRFQQANKGLTMGYTSATPNKPRIEWIHDGGSTADYLEFRVGNGFGSPGSPGANTLVASMSPRQGNTYFGEIDRLGNPFDDNFDDSPKVGIATRGQLGFKIFSDNQSSSIGSNIGAEIRVRHVNTGTGMKINVDQGQSSTGIFASVISSQNSIGVHARTNSNTTNSRAILGDAGSTGGNRFAGMFNGDVMITAGTFTVSDGKLKQNVVNEKSALERISLLRPVTYTYNQTDGIALSELDQHGFISQEMAEVFPELTKDVTQPVFDEDGKIVSDISYKAINYTGLISVLTAGIQELNTELSAVRDELAEYKANDKIRQSLVQDSRELTDYSMEQNIPNPFNDRTVIRYQLAPEVNQASITIFNLNGGFVKDYPINESKGEVTVLASEIGKGMFIYSLTRNGQEIMSKRMIVR